MFCQWHKESAPHPSPGSWGGLFITQHEVQFSRSVVSHSFDPMYGSTPGFPVHHQLWEFAQTHVRRVGDAIQPSHPLSSPSPPASNLSQRQGLFQWVSSSHQVDKVLEYEDLDAIHKRANSVTNRPTRLLTSQISTATLISWVFYLFFPIFHFTKMFLPSP